MRRSWLMGCGTLAFVVLALVCGLALWMFGSSSVQAQTPPSLSFLQPPEGTQVRLGETVNLQLQAQAASGRTLQGLLVRTGNTVIYRTGGNQPTLVVVAPWTPTRPGTYVLEAIAYDNQAQMGVARLRLMVQPLEGDQDGDGLPVALDRCPGTPGSLDAAGCPATLMPPDRDGDGVPDGADWCPDVPGPEESRGCLPPGTPDTDGDGLPDPVDSCPETPGDLRDSPFPGGEGNGCPDRDGDRVADPLDACPDTPGVPREDVERPGCPEPSRGAGDGGEGAPGEGEEGHGPPPPDRDGDGILDEDDACPDTPGIGGPYGGCLPPGPDSDRDGDGIPDIWDMCPDDPSPIWWPESERGCPPPPPDRVCPPPAGSPDARWDTDNDSQADPCDPDDDDDGWEDFVDLCPFIPGVGVAGASGCHPWLPGEEDADGDGVANRADRCPLHPGPSNAFNRGCPDDMDTAADEDGDGVPNRIDLCPGQAGDLRFLGCGEAGPDPDGDGLPWWQDACPEEDGLGMPNGCPLEIEVIDRIGLPVSIEDFRIPIPGERENRLVIELLAVETEEEFDRVTCMGQWEAWRGPRYLSEPFRLVMEGDTVVEESATRLAYRGEFPEDVILQASFFCMGVRSYFLPYTLGAARDIFFDVNTVREYERGLRSYNEWEYTRIGNEDFSAVIRFCYGDRCPEGPDTTLPVPEPLPDSLYLTAELISIEVINDGDPYDEGELRYVEVLLHNQTRDERLWERGIYCYNYPGRDFDQVRCSYSAGTDHGFDIEDGRTYPLTDNRRSSASPLLMEPGDELSLCVYAKEEDGFLESDESAEYCRYSMPAEEWRSLIDVPQTVELEPRPGDDFRIRVTFVLRAAPVGEP